jgi:integrase
MEQWRDAVHDAIYCTTDSVSEQDAEQIDADELWRDRPDVRENVRPVLADVGETAQFFAAKRLVLTNTARNTFLDYLYSDLSAALKRLERIAEGDHSPDKYVERFPKHTPSPDSGLAPWRLFEMWVSERKPAHSTVENWRYVLQGLQDHFEDRSAGSILPEEAEAWLRGGINAERSALFVKNTWGKAATTVFGWAAAQGHIARNPFADAVSKITVPKKQKLRETKAFRPEERTTILRAALVVTNMTKPYDASRRWVPWLCAYTGSRPGEITQLRGADVMESYGVHAMRLTPEAGTVKGGMARVVPIHEHLVEQGFLEFVKARGRGPLFYRPTERAAEPEDPMKRKKPRYAQARQRLAAWVRELGVDDPELSPNHAWRHTFKQIGRRAGIAESVLDNICGHAPASVGAAYGAASLDDMAEALRKFPRYSAGPHES